jgi:hypothetical protein
MSAAVVIVIILIIAITGFAYWSMKDKPDTADTNTANSNLGTANTNPALNPVTTNTNPEIKSIDLDTSSTVINPTGISPISDDKINAFVQSISSPPISL